MVLSSSSCKQLAGKRRIRCTLVQGEVGSANEKQRISQAERSAQLEQRRGRPGKGWKSIAQAGFEAEFEGVSMRKHVAH